MKNKNKCHLLSEEAEGETFKSSTKKSSAFCTSKSEVESIKTVPNVFRPIFVFFPPFHFISLTHPSLQISVAVGKSLPHCSTAQATLRLTSSFPERKSSTNRGRPPSPRNWKEDDLISTSYSLSHGMKFPASRDLFSNVFAELTGKRKRDLCPGLKWTVLGMRHDYRHVMLLAMWAH